MKHHFSGFPKHELYLQNIQKPIYSLKIPTKKQNKDIF